jgi:hypothetical protein
MAKNNAYTRSVVRMRGVFGENVGGADTILFVRFTRFACFSLQCLGAWHGWSTFVLLYFYRAGATLPFFETIWFFKQ